MFSEMKRTDFERKIVKTTKKESLSFVFFLGSIFNIRREFPLFIIFLLVKDDRIFFIEPELWGLVGKSFPLYARSEFRPSREGLSSLKQLVTGPLPNAWQHV